MEQDFTNERRRYPRAATGAPIRVSKAPATLPLSDVAVLNVSRGGIAIETRVPLNRGDRLSFTTDVHLPPILAEVLNVESGRGRFVVRCRCLLGEFAAAPATALSAA